FLEEPLAFVMRRDGVADGRDELRASAAHRDLACRRHGALLEKLEARRRPGQAGALAPDAARQLLMPQAPHAADLFGRYVVGDQAADLAQREPEIPEDEDAVEALELRGRIEAVAIRALDARRAEQPDLVIVA